MLLVFEFSQKMVGNENRHLNLIQQHNETAACALVGKKTINQRYRVDASQKKHSPIPVNLSDCEPPSEGEIVSHTDSLNDLEDISSDLETFNDQTASPDCIKEISQVRHCNNQCVRSDRFTPMDKYRNNHSMKYKLHSFASDIENYRRFRWSESSERTWSKMRSTSRGRSISRVRSTSRDRSTSKRQGRNKSRSRRSASRDRRRRRRNRSRSRSFENCGMQKMPKTNSKEKWEAKQKNTKRRSLSEQRKSTKKKRSRSSRERKSHPNNADIYSSVSDASTVDETYPSENKYQRKEQHNSDGPIIERSINETAAELALVQACTVSVSGIQENNIFNGQSTTAVRDIIHKIQQVQPENTIASSPKKEQATSTVQSISWTPSTTFVTPPLPLPVFSHFDASQMPTVSLEGLSLVPGTNGLPVHIGFNGQIIPHDMAGRRIPVGPNGHYLPVDLTGRLFPHIVSPQNIAVPVYMSEDNVIRLLGGEPVPFGPGHNLPVNVDGNVILIGRDSRPLHHCPNLPKGPKSLLKGLPLSSYAQPERVLVRPPIQTTQCNARVPNTNEEPHSNLCEEANLLNSSIKWIENSKDCSIEPSSSVQDSSDNEGTLQIVCDSKNTTETNHTSSCEDKIGTIRRIEDVVASLHNENCSLLSFGQFRFFEVIRSPPKAASPNESPLTRNRVTIPFATPAFIQSVIEGTMHQKWWGEDVAYRFTSDCKKKKDGEKCTESPSAYFKESETRIHRGVQCDLTATTLLALNLKIRDLKMEIARLVEVSAK